jgi:DNA-binding MarR family transcriptional regulator
VRISEKGLELLKQIDKQNKDDMADLTVRIPSEEAALVNSVLDRMRG